MLRLEAKLGASSETLRIIHREMERDYYNAETRLVDPLLSRCGESPSRESWELAAAKKLLSSDVCDRSCHSVVISLWRLGSLIGCALRKIVGVGEG